MKYYLEIKNLITNDEGCSTVKSLAVGDQKVCTKSLFSLNIRSNLFGTPTAAKECVLKRETQRRRQNNLEFGIWNLEFGIWNLKF